MALVFWDEQPLNHKAMGKQSINEIFAVIVAMRDLPLLSLLMISCVFNAQ